MIFQNEKEKLKYFKEWRCTSRPYRYYETLILFPALALFICWGGIAITDQIGIKNNQIVRLYLILGSLVFAFLITYLIYKKQKHDIKQVRFTPEAIYVEGTKIDLCYLNRISFVEKIKMSQKMNKYNALPISSEFKMSFLLNPILNEDIHFYMELSKGRFGNDPDYDYQNRFIKVLQDLAEERRKKLQKI